MVYLLRRVFRRVAVTIKGQGATGNCYVIVDGTKYVSEASGLELMPGSVIVVLAPTGKSLIVNGSSVHTFVSESDTYGWIVPSGTSAVTITMNGGWTGDGNINIVTS